MFFCSRRHVRLRDKWKTLYFNFSKSISTNLKTDMAYDKVATWRVKNLCFHMAHDYQNWQDDDLWHWATLHKVAWFFHHVIMCCLVTKKKRYISNTTSPTQTKIDEIVA